VVRQSKSLPTRLLGLGAKQNLEIWMFLKSGSESELRKSSSEFSPARMYYRCDNDVSEKNFNFFVEHGRTHCFCFGLL